MFSPNMRYVVICVASILIFGCLIWLAWELEEAREPIRTDVLGADEHGNFVVRLREQDRYDLILHCDEEKFQEAFEAFKKNLEIDDSYPPLKVPGGPMVVALADELLPENLIPAKNAAVEDWFRHGTIEHDSEIKLASNITACFDKDLIDGFPCRPGLDRNQRVSE